MRHTDIYVTQPHLPPSMDFVPYLEQIWSNRFLTNDGTFHEQLEGRLCANEGICFLED
jgi:hypothetical protein